MFLDTFQQEGRTLPIELYAQIFSAIDRIDQWLSYIKFPCRQNDFGSIYLFYLIRLTVIGTFASWIEYRLDNGFLPQEIPADGDARKQTIRSFLRQLVTELCTGGPQTA